MRASYIKYKLKSTFFLFQALQTINRKYQTLLFFRLIMVIRYVNIIPSEEVLDRITGVLTRNAT